MRLKNDIYVYEWTNAFENNCNSYYIGGSVQALIDPGLTGYVPDLLDRMSADGIKKDDIRYVINTHSHPDHFQGSEVFDQEKVRVGLHTKEIEFLKGEGGELYSLFGINAPRMNVNFPLEEGDVVLGDQIFKIILAPGHSPGSIGLYWPGQKALFCGDVIFDLSVGRTDFPGGSGALLKESILSFSKLDLEWLLPGHMGILCGKDKIKDNFNIVVQSIFLYI
ncbi:MAG: MBL fold metallo-hydrolase [Deltaproteobacteria bacterium HGW-Deltaproteobacteria-13]|jgi:glyoxylase-like metal-dependent hydrolase (beta-lactamase superfamily II)|nr:MAG: MBL fold metallo-hydrolase [Deltaproteobacteria bacterium HGW-Deltaproteobacteria-13]